MGLHGEPVLVFPADPVFAREDFRGFAHVQSADRIGEAELQGDAGLEIGKAKFSQRGEFFPHRLCAGQRPVFLRRARLKEQRHLRHVLRAADHEDFAASRRHPFAGRRHRFKAGGAVAMHRDGRHRFRYARPQRDDPRDVRRLGGLADAAENDLVDALRIEAGAGEQRAHGDAAQFVGPE